MTVALGAMILRKLSSSDKLSGIEGRLTQIGSGLEKAMREEIEASRTRADDIARKAREESAAHAKQAREESATSAKQAREELDRRLSDVFKDQGDRLDGFSKRLGDLIEASEKRGETLRVSVEGRLDKLREENSHKLEAMRLTVDEKLQSTLEKRLGESFKQVSERLEQVHKGLGEMQNLATGVGDLKRVMTNVKTRGSWGEYQLGAILEDVLTPSQYIANAETKPGSGGRVEFAICLPGQGNDPSDRLLLPIDAKFPSEDYQRLLDAQDAADVEQVAAAGKQLERAVKECAKTIENKYIAPPHTTDFALMFLPTEGLYAEVIRRVDLVEHCRRHHRVMFAGPTTLSAILNSLSMGFRTLAIQERSSEVWKVLGGVKTEFGKFGDVLDKVKKKLTEASNVVDTAQVRSRALDRTLRKVDAASEPDTMRMLGLPGDLDEPDAGSSEDTAEIGAV